MRCFPRENSEKIKLGTSGGLWGPVGAASPLKMGPEAEKAKNADGGGNGVLGGQNRPKTKKKFFFGESKVCASV